MKNNCSIIFFSENKFSSKFEDFWNSGLKFKIVPSIDGLKGVSISAKMPKSVILFNNFLKWHAKILKQIAWTKNIIFSSGYSFQNSSMPFKKVIEKDDTAYFFQHSKKCSIYQLWQFINKVWNIISNVCFVQNVSINMFFHLYLTQSG